MYFPKLKHWACGALVIAVSLFVCNSGRFEICRENWVSICLYGLVLPFVLNFAEKNTKVTSIRLKVYALLVSCLFALFIAIGKNYYQQFSWSLCFGGKSTIAWLLLQIAVYTYNIYIIVRWMLNAIENCDLHDDSRPINLKNWFTYNLAVRGVFFCAFFPCLFDFDASLGLRTFLDPDSAICDHHPVFVQAIHACFFSLGEVIGSKTCGFAILSGLYILASSLVIVYCLSLVNRTRLGRKWKTAIAAVFTFAPFFPYLSLLPTKDGFFTYAFLLYVAALMELYLTNTDCLNHKSYLLIHNLAILFVCLTRNQGLIIVVLVAIALLIYYRRNFRALLISMVPALATVLLITKIVFPAFDVEPGGKQELYGTLFQQTANCLWLYPNDVSEIEVAAINTILDKDAMIANYEFHITDPVKNDYIYNPRFSQGVGCPRTFRHIDRTQETEDLKNYLSAWISMGKRHPMAYVQATSAIALGFFYNIDKVLIDVYNEGFYHPVANTPQYQYWRVDYFHRLFSQCQKSLMNIPFINWICSIPYYLWATVLLIVLLLYRKDIQGLVILLPVILSLGILVVCPVVSGRYVFPIVAVLPLVVMYVFSSNKSIENK